MTHQNKNKRFIPFLLSFLCASQSLHAELTPLLLPTLNTATNKYAGKSVIADSIDNQAPGQQYRDRIYFYDLALDNEGKAYVLYAQPKPLTLDSSEPYDFDLEKTDIILAIETEKGWDKQILSIEGVYRPAAIQIEKDSQHVFHLIYIRSLSKEFFGEFKSVDYLVYRKIEKGVVSKEMEVGDLTADPVNLAGLGGWRTRMAIAPDDSVYMIREGGNEGLTRPQLNLLSPDGHGNWVMEEITGLPTANWYRVGEFLIDKVGKPHLVFADYAYNHKAEAYITKDYFEVDQFGFHHLWYGGSDTLDAQNWQAVKLDEDPNSPAPALYSYEFWPDLSLDENNNPAIATWLWRVDTEFPGYGSSTVFFQRENNTKNWDRNRTTRIFDEVSFRPKGQLAGMGPGLLKDATGWHGVWDSSHPRPFEHSYLRGGIMYRHSPDGKNWASYQPIAEFSGEGYSIVKVDKQNRLNILVLGDHTDTQLYLLRYQLPNPNLMEVFADRRYYYLGESVTLHARVQPDAVGDFYVVAISEARSDIKQPSETWQLTPTMKWTQISGLDKLQPLLKLPSGAGLNFNDVIATVDAGEKPFDKPDTHYKLYSVVAEPNSNPLSGQWVTPLFTQDINVNTSFPE